MKKMISVAEAKGLIAERVLRMESVSVRLMDGLGRCLADDIFSPIDMPGFAQSAMDGYAFSWRGYEASGKMEIVGEVAAGAAEAGPRPAPYQAVRIFTGAPVPEGFDTVLMQEKASVLDGMLEVLDLDLICGRNVRLAGSEIAKGALAMKKGTILTVAGIGFLASLGLEKVEVVREPRVTLIVTGDELQQPGLPLGFGQVYESNSQLLQAAFLHLRFLQPKIVYAKDNLPGLTESIRLAMLDSDMIVLTGGVSVGDYDFVVPAAEAAGTQSIFHKIKQKPGKPLFFGVKDGVDDVKTDLVTAKQTVVFGLPGNPASVLTCFYQYVLTALELASGCPVSLKVKTAT
ncbi:MAG: molybdopterin molybdotransferase MoeA, partial [Bacteroidetes bacterium]|nr:molybdopterin molybdotransferase MoeA [Bacteroidota bacterium]